MSETLTVRDPYAAIRALVLDSVSSPASKRSYCASLVEFSAFLDRTGQPLCKASVQAFRASLEGRGLSASTINVKLAAVRKLAGEAADNALLDPALAAGVARVKGAKKLGVRAGNWLTLEQAAALIRQPDNTLKGSRDRAILMLLVGCGVRRAELVSLTVTHLQPREGRWVLLDVIGKGGRIRTIPVPAWAYTALAEWLRQSGITEGLLFRSIARGEMGRAISTQAVADMVHDYSAAIGHTVAPHDMRRTYAKLARASGGALEQIQISLGHSSIVTTALYLGIHQDLKSAPGDLIPL
jgi:integrase/recombinase XerD